MALNGSVESTKLKESEVISFSIEKVKSKDFSMSENELLVEAVKRKKFKNKHQRLNMNERARKLIMKCILKTMAGNKKYKFYSLEDMKANLEEEFPLTGEILI